MYKLGLILVGIMLGVGFQWVEAQVIGDRDVRIHLVATEYCSKYKHCNRDHNSPTAGPGSEAEHLISVRRCLIEKEEKATASGKNSLEFKTAIKRLDHALSHKSNYEFSI
ncbi:MAG: hypothetical protein K2X93_13695 [Candidatus Obscuribacterales bacterium]|nr:hypothetical protein [Candidatus Obscuribacterales bacterium]